MDFLHLSLLGLVQSLTEFLPISSSGHILLLNSYLSASQNFFIEVFLNTATLVSVFLFLKQKISFLRIHLLHIIISTLPLILFGLFLSNTVDHIFNTISFLPFTFLLTSLFVLSTRFVKPSSANITLTKAILIGLAQVLAVLPGVSRSATTTSTALILGVTPQLAFTYSFYLYIPASLGAIGLFISKSPPATFLNPSYLAVFFLSATLGYLVLRLISRLVIRGKFWLFGLYTIGLSIYLFLSIY